LTTTDNLDDDAGVTDLHDENTASFPPSDEDDPGGVAAAVDPNDQDPGDAGAAAQRDILGDLFSGLIGLFRGAPNTAPLPAQAAASPAGPIPFRPRSRAIEREQEKDLLAKMRAKETIEERLERYRQMIEGFEEDRENILEKVGRWFFLILAYVAPILIALAVGREIGDAYGGPFSWGDGWSLGAHAGAYFGELSLAMMSLASATALRRVQSDKTYIYKLLAAVFFLVVFSIASGLAQWYIALTHVAMVNGGTPALLFRVLMPPAVDIASLIYISVMGFKSLKKHLANMKLMADSLRELNEAEIGIRKSQNMAKQQENRENLLMKVEGLQADAVIKAVEQSLNGQTDKRGWQMRS
jgi:hypothetical protein